jgi:hypothetical protein
MNPDLVVHDDHELAVPPELHGRAVPVATAGRER